MAEAPPTSTDTPSCSPLEQEVLDEYAHLLGNLNKVLYPLLSLFSSVIHQSFQQKM